MNFFSVRLAKGVRISASPRGLRAHVGPRGSRLHFGGGGTGVSTGAGPFTYYTSLDSGTRRRTSSGAGGPSRSELARAEKEREVARLAAQIEAILNVHRAEFPKAEPPVAPAAEPSDPGKFLAARTAELVRGIPVWKFRDRRAARERAEELAREDAQQEELRLAEDREALQRQLDEGWERLLANDPVTVIDTVDAAFEDNRAPAAPVNVEGSTLSLVLLAPGNNEIPDKKPAVSPSGRPTVKKMTRTEAAEAYLTLICGHLLATIKEALAVAPAITEMKSVVVRQTEPDAFGERHVEVLLAAAYRRASLDRVDWVEADAPQIVEQAADYIDWKLKGRPPELKPLSLDEEPELKIFIEALGDLKH